MHIYYIINILYSLPQQVIYFSSTLETLSKGFCNVTSESLLSNITQGYSKAQNWVLHYANCVLLQEMNMQHAVSKIKTEFSITYLGKHIQKEIISRDDSFQIQFNCTDLTFVQLFLFIYT